MTTLGRHWGKLTYYEKCHLVQALTIEYPNVHMGMLPFIKVATIHRTLWFKSIACSSYCNEVALFNKLRNMINEEVPE